MNMVITPNYLRLCRTELERVDLRFQAQHWQRPIPVYVEKCMYRLTKQIGDHLAEGRGGQGLSQAFTDEIFQYLRFQKKIPRNFKWFKCGNRHTYFMGWSPWKLLKKGQFVPSQATGRIPPGYYRSQRQSKSAKDEQYDGIAKLIIFFGFLIVVIWAAIKAYWP